MSYNCGMDTEFRDILWQQRPLMSKKIILQYFFNGHMSLIVHRIAFYVHLIKGLKEVFKSTVNNVSISITKCIWLQWWLLQPIIYAGMSVHYLATSFGGEDR